jgi:nitroreductase
MTVMEAIQGRKSIRSYSPKPIEPEKITAVMEAARLAPSARNRQMWKFIVVTDSEVKDKLVGACNGQQSVRQAPAVIIACGESPGIMTCGQPVESIDVSIALSFVMLKAYEEGLGTCWLGNFNQDEVKAAANVPDDVVVVAVTPLGYPAESPDARPRKAFDEVVSYDKY